MILENIKFRFHIYYIIKNILKFKINWIDRDGQLTDDGTTTEVRSVHENADLPRELVGLGLGASDDVGSNAIAHLSAGVWNGNATSDWRSGNGQVSRPQESSRITAIYKFNLSKYLQKASSVILDWKADYL